MTDDESCTRAKKAALELLGHECADFTIDFDVERAPAFDIEVGEGYESVFDADLIVRVTDVTDDYVIYELVQTPDGSPIDDLPTDAITNIEPIQIFRSARAPTDAVVVDDDPGLDPSEWDRSDWNSFFGDCRRAGFDAAECGDKWSDAKDESADTDANPRGNGDMSDPSDVLVVKEETEASEAAAQALMDPIGDGDVEVIDVGTDEGVAILTACGEPAVPFHAVRDGDGYERGDITDLIATHLA